MKTLIKSLFFLVLFISFFRIQTANGQIAIDLESGLVATGYNDVRIPGNAGTFFSLKDDLKPDAKVFLRARLSYTIKSRHTLQYYMHRLQYIRKDEFQKISCLKERNFQQILSLPGSTCLIRTG